MPKGKKKILIAILDWGLGHATRCIPIIKLLEERGNTVILASSGTAFQLLAKEFPKLSILELPAYHVKYYSKNMFWNMAIQGPRILWTIFKEHREIKKSVAKHKIDLLISDSRFGCFDPSIKSIFISHQLNIQVPAYLTKWVNYLNHFMIKQFDECWVPDLADTDKSLAGRLAHPAPVPVKYIGPLSRMHLKDKEIKYDVLIILSGPEPQRTRLESILWNQIQTMDKRILFIQGLPGMEKEYLQIGTIKKWNYLTAEELNAAIAESAIMVCRSGYSSIMDLAALGKKAILIPTPGQTEQEYLAAYFEEKKIFFAQEQDQINLSKAIKEINNYSGMLHSSKINIPLE